MHKFNVVFIASALAWVGHPSSASADVPAWCGGATFKDRLDLNDLSSKDPEKIVVTFAQAVCAPTPEAEAHKAEIETARQAWSQKLGMIEADWADVVAFAKGKSYKITASTNNFAAYTPIDQYVAITERFSQRPGVDDYLYVADMFEQQMTEVGRLGIIERCLGYHSDTPSVEWAICQPDIDKLDMAKFATQLRSDTAHLGDMRMTLRFAAYEDSKLLKDHVAEVAKLFKRDDAYKRIFDITAKARTEWESGPGTNTQLLALVQQMDSAAISQSRKQIEGCEPKTTAALTAEVSKVPASVFKGMHDTRYNESFATTAAPALTAFPAVNLAAIAYSLCQPKAATTKFLTNGLQETAGYRGPRTAALTRISSENIELDDKNAHVSYPGFDSRPYRANIHSDLSVGGAIASTKVEGDIVTVTLEPMMVTYDDCVVSHTTNKISNIRNDGRVEYQSVCDRSAMVAHDEAWGPFAVKKMYAPLLKKGVVFSLVTADNGDAEIVAIWPNKKAKVPNWIVGGKVK
jgi:hypothetical protein